MTGNSTEVLTAALKDNKSSHVDMNENLRFKPSRLNYKNNKKRNKTNKKNEHMRLVIGIIGVGVVAKTDDEIYVPSTMKRYSYIVT